MSKVVERLVCQQLARFLEKHKNLLPKCQSTYRRYHSTETAVLKVVSDALSAAKNGEVALLGMLDMSAAFDTVDHDILLKKLHMLFGIRGAAPSWISSFVRQGRKQSPLTAKYPKRRWSPVVFPRGSPRSDSVPALHGERGTHRRNA